MRDSDAACLNVDERKDQCCGREREQAPVVFIFVSRDTMECWGVCIFFFLRIGDPWFVGKRKEAFRQFMTAYG